MNTQAKPILEVAGAGLERAHVVVLYGGRSGEREVSLSTGREVLAALAPLARPATDDRRGPARATGVEIDARGRWLLGGRDVSPGEGLFALGPVDVFFLALHGGEGEDGTLQGWLAQNGARFTGSGVQASALCMDKLAMRGVASQVGIPVAPGLCFSRATWQKEPRRLERIAELSTSGWVVKPRSGGSSVNTFLLRGRSEIEAAVHGVLETGDDVLIEARIAGVELSCGVLGNRLGAPTALPPVEIQPREGAFFDYKEKYSAEGAREVCPPESLSAADVARVQELALLAHGAAGCDGYSRTDFILPRQGGDPVMLEVNTLPGLTPRSLLPQEAAAIGVDYRSLCLYLAAIALAAEQSA